MKEKRHQREEEQSRNFSLPTGGVDIAQLAALGICPPFQINSANHSNQQYNGGVPSRVDLRVPALQHPVSATGNFPYTHSPYTGLPGIDNSALMSAIPNHADLNVLRNDYLNGRTNVSINQKGLVAPTAVYPGRQSLPNMRNISPNSANYHYMSQGR